MCSSTRVYPQKLTEFWQIYKASYILFIGIWQGMTLMSWMCFVLSLGKSSHISPSYSLQKNCCFCMLSKDSLEHGTEIPEDHLCNEPCWKAAGSQGLAGWTPAPSPALLPMLLLLMSWRWKEKETAARGRKMRKEPVLSRGKWAEFSKGVGERRTGGNWEKEPLEIPGKAFGQQLR